MRLCICDHSSKDEAKLLIKRKERLRLLLKRNIRCNIDKSNNILYGYARHEQHQYNDLLSKVLHNDVIHMTVFSLFERSGCIIRLLQELSFALTKNGKVEIILSKTEMKDRLVRLPFTSSAEVIHSYHAVSQAGGSRNGVTREFYKAAGRFLELSRRASGDEKSAIYSCFQYTGHGLVAIILDTFLLRYHSLKPSLTIREDEFYWIVTAKKTDPVKYPITVKGDIQSKRLDILQKSKYEYISMIS